MTIRTITLGGPEDIKPGMWVKPYPTDDSDEGANQVIHCDGGEITIYDRCEGLDTLIEDEFQICEAPKAPRVLCTTGIMDDRDYLFYITKYRRSEPRVVAGCQNFTISEAYDHWGDKNYHQGKARGAAIRKILNKLVAQARKLGMIRNGAVRHKAKKVSKRKAKKARR